MKGSTIFRYVFAARGGYGNASALADAYRQQMGVLRGIAAISGFLMVASIVVRWEDGPNHLTAPLFAICSVAFMLSLGLLMLGLEPIRRFLFR